MQVLQHEVEGDDKVGNIVTMWTRLYVVSPNDTVVFGKGVDAGT